jgi:hypothetical protein
LDDIAQGVAYSLNNRRNDPSSRERSELSYRRKRVDEAQYYESFRQLAVDSPGAAVREAYQRVRLSGQRLLQDVQQTGWRVRVNSLHMIFEGLADEKLVDPDAVEPARRLDRIYHSPERSELSTKGALSFVEAAQKLENLITEARERLERGHVLRSIKAQSTVKGWLADFGFAESDVKTTVTTKGLVLSFRVPKAGIDTDPRYIDLVRQLRGFARVERIVIHVRHPDAESTLR